MNCPNCKSEINQEIKFCNECGQKNTSMRISLKEFLGNFFQEYLSFDTRFFRSIGPLLFKPGYLANKFFEGKRKRFVDPLRFYVFVSFLTFLLAGYADMNFLNVDSGTDFEKAIAEDERIEITTTPGEVKEVTKKDFISALEQIVDHQDQINANMMRYISVALFLLMPIFALINSLMFFRRRDYFLEHLILSFHIHTFFLLLSILALIAHFIATTNVFWVVLILLTIYTIISFKKYYRTSWGGSIWRFFISVGTYSFVLLIAVSLISVLAIYLSGATDIFNLGS